MRSVLYLVKPIIFIDFIFYNYCSKYCLPRIYWEFTKNVIVCSDFGDPLENVPLLELFATVKDSSDKWTIAKTSGPNSPYGRVSWCWPASCAMAWFSVLSTLTRWRICICWDNWRNPASVMRPQKHVSVYYIVHYSYKFIVLYFSSPPQHIFFGPFSYSVC